MTLGVNWIERLIKLNNLFTVTQKSREVARVVAIDPRVFKSYFYDFQKTREKYGVLVCWIFPILASTHGSAYLSLGWRSLEYG